MTDQSENLSDRAFDGSCYVQDADPAPEMGLFSFMDLTPEFLKVLATTLDLTVEEIAKIEAGVIPVIRN